MATDEQMDLDSQQKAPTKSANRRFFVFLTIIIVSVVALAGGVMFYLNGSSSNHQNPQGAHEVSLAAPIYVDLAPPFTVNFRGTRGPRFLQISVEAMTREPEVEDLLKQHMPVIRNQLVLLFSSQSYENLDKREGKEKLIQETLETIQGVLRKASGRQGIEAVYFTSFVMQ
jgi:flagellar FliL protein